MILLAKDAEAAVRQDGMRRGRLRLGSMETTAAVRLREVLQRFHAAHPEVVLEERTGPTAELLQRVLDYELDCAFVAGPINHPELTARPAFLEELVLVYGAGSDPAKARKSDQPLTGIVFRQGCSYRQRLEAHFAQRGWLPSRRLEIGTLEGILGFVAAGVGVTLLPRRAVEYHPVAAQLHLSRVPGPLGRAPTLLVARAGAPAGPLMQALVEQIQAERKAGS